MKKTVGENSVQADGVWLLVFVRDVARAGDFVLQVFCHILSMACFDGLL